MKRQQLAAEEELMFPFAVCGEAEALACCSVALSCLVASRLGRVARRQKVETLHQRDWEHCKEELF